MRKLIAGVVLALVMFAGTGTGVAFADHPAASHAGLDRAGTNVGWNFGEARVPGSNIFDKPAWNNQPLAAASAIEGHNPPCAEHEDW